MIYFLLIRFLIQSVDLSIEARSLIRSNSVIWKNFTPEMSSKEPYTLSYLYDSPIVNCNNHTHTSSSTHPGIPSKPRNDFMKIDCILNPSDEGLSNNSMGLNENNNMHPYNHRRAKYEVMISIS